MSAKQHKTPAQIKTEYPFAKWVPVAIHKKLLNKEGTFSADAIPGTTPADTSKEAPKPAPKPAPAKKGVMDTLKANKGKIIAVVVILGVVFVAWKYSKKKPA
jgi:hypothetical protein